MCLLQAFDVTLHGRQGRVCLVSEPRCIEPAGYLHPENLALVMTSKGSECSVPSSRDVLLAIGGLDAALRVGDARELAVRSSSTDVSTDM